MVYVNYSSCRPSVKLANRFRDEAKLGLKTLEGICATSDVYNGLQHSEVVAIHDIIHNARQRHLKALNLFDYHKR
ncbi:TPA: hypothetical protein I7730_01095 [Vibrio vulnificus]|uniref:Uncharacterized protein n=1 Tax=Vibrio vulnificus TaxID=672 RepID=A0A8H9MZ82_VIBVL|nr:hypothetical protein [Vibrio vulnificus]